MSLQMFWLNNQQGGGGLTGPIDVVTIMSLLNSLWFHGNQFKGTIPESIGNLTHLSPIQACHRSWVGFKVVMAWSWRSEISVGMADFDGFI
nr:hypothetical protein CFP56_75329 [Quercus suber]